MKKLVVLMLAFAVFAGFSGFAAVDHADAKGFKSGKRSYNQTPSKSTDNVSKTDGGATKGTTNTGAATTNRGFFSGGGFMKGLMIGGLAGMLFGGMFGGMGFFGDMLGLLVNVAAIVILIAVIRKIYVYFKDRKKLDENPKRY